MNEEKCTCTCGCCTGVTEEISLPNIIVQITYNDNSNYVDVIDMDDLDEE